MPRYKRLNGSIQDNRAFENMKADIERNKANTDYIAMMSDVELPTNNETEEIQHEG